MQRPSRPWRRQSSPVRQRQNSPVGLLVEATSCTRAAAVQASQNNEQDPNIAAAHLLDNHEAYGLRPASPPPPARGSGGASGSGSGPGGMFPCLAQLPEVE